MNSPPDEVRTLRHCVRDVVALSALSATWGRTEPRGIAESLAEVLLNTLDLDFLYVRVKGLTDGVVHESVRTPLCLEPTSRAEEIGMALRPLLDPGGSAPPPTIDDPVAGSGPVRIAVLPIGYEGDCGHLIAASWRPDFPTLADRLLLGVGATQAAVVLQFQRAESELRRREARFRLLVEQASDAFFLLDTDGRIVDASRRACDSLGCTRDEVLRLGVRDIEAGVTPERVSAIWAGITPDAPVTFEGVHRRRDGTNFPVEVRVGVIEEGGHRLFLALARDITERQRATVRLEHQASHDALTGLPNRAHFHDRLTAAIVTNRQRDAPLAVLLIDLDRFKEVNDTLGHHCGDLVLKQLNPRLCAALRHGDLVSRLGGDEFALLLPGADRNASVQVAERVLAELHRPAEVGGNRIDVGASVGIALYPAHGPDAETLLRHADIAMYVAKRARSGYEVYADDQAVCSPRRLALVAELRRAVEEEQLLLHYQPKVDLKTRRVCGAEALARWPHPREGMVPPGEFIPLAEQTGLIRPLGVWSLKTALLQCAAWRAAGLDLFVAVNLAADNLQDAQLCDTIAALLADARVPAGRLTVEVTESTMMTDPGHARAVLGRLHDAGIRIAIDDFGTGYSSLVRKTVIEHARC